MKTFRCLFCMAVLSSVLVSCSKKDIPTNSQNNGNGGNSTPPTTTVYGYGDEWLTQSDQSSLFAQQTNALVFNDLSQSNVITVDSTTKYQQIDGFGFALTDGSAMLINQLSATNQNNLLHQLFDTSGTDIGVSYLRLTIGASDLSPYVYSYDDMPNGQTDSLLNNFNVSNTITGTDVIPVLQKILAINPNVKTIATPWSAPAWMKDNNAVVGGNLLTTYYASYANYFVKYLQAMQAAGITVTAMTPQNEPEYGGNNPSMLLPANNEAAFVQNFLGPAFQAAGITTKIVVYDHNCDDPSYPESILANTNAAQYVDGSSFHLYAGDISALSTVHNAYPNKNLYFTEMWTSSTSTFATDFPWAIQNLIIGAPQNWSKNVLEWNLASDPNMQPHTSGNGCSTCLGAITISGSSVSAQNQSYYIVAHASKFVRPGSYRIASTTISNVASVAFLTPSGKKVLIAMNTSSTAQNFNIKFNGHTAQATLNVGAVATFVW